MSEVVQLWMRVAGARRQWPSFMTIPGWPPIKPHNTFIRAWCYPSGVRAY